MKNRILTLILLAGLLVSCSGGGIKTETRSDEEWAAVMESESAEKAAKESEAMRIAQESRELAESIRESEAESRREKSEQLAREKEEDKAMAEADFEANRYTSFMGVDYELTFIDTFNGHHLDESKWVYCPEWTRDQCVWKESAAYLEDGNLILAVTGDEIPYDAGAIRTRDIFEQAYGYWEVRCRLPEEEGICGAFWLMSDGAGADTPYGAADGAEIDIIEFAHHDAEKIQHAIHFDGYGEHHQSTYHEMTVPGIYDGEYHTFSMVWTPTEYTFYVDGEETWVLDDGDYLCHAPCYMKLTAAVGGWAGTLDPKKVPCRGLTVDYVKVYMPVEPYEAAD